MVTSATAVSGSTAAAQTSRNTMISSDFDTFLKLLTAQMKNQDPLNPIDSTDYATQLATFSGVEQQMRSNDLLEDLGSQLAVLGMSQLAAWVGQEARAEAPVWMDGDPVALQFSAAVGADKAVLLVKDTAGRLVAREDVPVTAGNYRWLGADATGDPLPDGLYSLSLESYSGDERLGEGPVEAYARIVEARNGPNGPMLVLEGGVEVDAGEISALRVPDLATD
jgi:flagellar basal-body rod modification protein FlgD